MVVGGGGGRGGGRGGKFDMVGGEGGERKMGVKVGGGWVGEDGGRGGRKVEHGVNTVEGRKGGSECWGGWERRGQRKVIHSGRGGGGEGGESWGERAGAGGLNMVEVRVGEERGRMEIGLGWKEAVHTRYRIPACIFPFG